MLKGVEGSGKGTVYKLIKNMIGHRYCLTTNRVDKDIFGQFNWIMYKKVFININEAEYQSFAKNFEQFKSLVTDEDMVLEEKGKSRIHLSNYIWWLITTNNDRLFSLSLTDRRFYFVECSNKLCGNTAYFSRLHEALDDKATLQSFMMYLKNIPKLDYDFDEERKKNKTEFHRLLEATSIPSTYAFLQQLIESDDLQQYRTDDCINASTLHPKK